MGLSRAPVGEGGENSFKCQIFRGAHLQPPYNVFSSLYCIAIHLQIFQKIDRFLKQIYL